MKFQRLLMDTNVLLLLVVGSLAREYVHRHERLKQFSAADYDLLREVMALAQRVATTPCAWTEVHHLLKFRDRPLLNPDLYWSMKTEVAGLVDVHVASVDATNDHAYLAVGFADAALLTALDEQTTLLTIDVPLYRQATSRGHRAVNFHHLREERGL